MRGVLIEARRTPLRWVSVLLAGVLVAFMLVNRADWSQVWQRASAAIDTPVFYVGPILAGAQAARVGAIARQGVGEVVDAGTRPSWAVALTQMVAGALWALVPVVFGVLTAGAVMVGSSAPGFVDLGYVLLAVLGLWWCVGVGQLLGSMGGPLWFSPIAAAMVCLFRFGIPYGNGYGSGGLDRVVAGAPSYLEINWIALGAVVLELLALGVLAVAVPWMWGRVRLGKDVRHWPGGAGRALTASACTCIVVVSVVATAASPSLTRERSAPSSSACAGSAITACVWPQDSAYLPMMSNVLMRATTDVAPFGFVVAGRTSEVGLSDDDTFTLVGSGEWTFAEGVADHIMGETYPLSETCDIPESGAQVDQFHVDYFEVSAWIALRLHGAPRPADINDTSTTDWSSLEDLVEADVADQSAWLAPRMDRLRQTTDAWCTR